MRKSTSSAGGTIFAIAAIAVADLHRRQRDELRLHGRRSAGRPALFAVPAVAPPTVPLRLRALPLPPARQAPDLLQGLALRAGEAPAAALALREPRLACRGHQLQAMAEEIEQVLRRFVLAVVDVHVHGAIDLHVQSRLLVHGVEDTYGPHEEAPEGLVVGKRQGSGPVQPLQLAIEVAMLNLLRGAMIRACVQQAIRAASVGPQEHHGHRFVLGVVGAGVAGEARQ
mmetsp:Transcript_17582/g.61455  ORF Transcript_17582/g.61455 Transcript_17582/m.61455 type:complete len:227 (-) Transcript_17582:979-1659(-)